MKASQSLPLMVVKVFLGVFLSWVVVGIIGLILAARSPAALRLGESDIRVALMKRRGRKGVEEGPMLWAVSLDHPMPARGPNIHPPTREAVAYQTLRSADSGKWAVVGAPKDKDFGRVFIDCTHTDSRGSFWSSY